jgi:hypothetical protein
MTTAVLLTLTVPTLSRALVHLGSAASNVHLADMLILILAPLVKTLTAIDALSTTTQNTADFAKTDSSWTSPLIHVSLSVLASQKLSALLTYVVSSAKL